VPEQLSDQALDGLGAPGRGEGANPLDMQLGFARDSGLFGLSFIPEPCRVAIAARLRPFSGQDLLGALARVSDGPLCLLTGARGELVGAFLRFEQS
jgi:hypothetical protein